MHYILLILIQAQPQIQYMYVYVTSATNSKPNKGRVGCPAKARGLGFQKQEP